ncbi:MAG: DNA translocase FtsK [Opitutae bacterium]|nr:DNA translocase FtsK [Opitutae bacterium]
MPKPQSSNPNKDGPSFQAPRQRPRWLMAVLCFLFFLLLTVALVDFRPEQSIFTTTNPTEKNLVGFIGAETSWWLLHLIGVSTILLPIFLGWLSYIAMRAVRRFATTRYVAMFVSILALSGLASMQTTFLTNPRIFTNGPGGALGRLIYDRLLKDSVGVFGSGVLLCTLYGLSLLFVFTRDIGAEFDRLMQWFQTWREHRAQLKAERDEKKRLLKEMQAKQKLEAQAAAAKAASAPAAPTATAAPAAPVGPTSKKISVPKIQDEPLAAKPSARAPEPETPKPPPPPAPPALTLEKKPAKGEASAPATSTKDLAVATGKLELNIVKPEEPKKAKATVPQSDDSNYVVPPLTLLKEQVKPSPENSEEEHRRNAENLLRILSEFGVEVTLGEIHVGPVITRYEVAPAAGVRVEKIAGLDKNIALGMRAQSVRILAPIPGKAAVGVEVPNQHPTPVGMREILESEDWVGSKAELPIVLGKDVSGKPLISDLTKMPHLLIAGATGSGKSVCINSIIASVLYSKSPKDVRLLMVDPKVVELKVFNTLPHMLIPVVTEPKKVPGALKWLLNEMEQRYQMFAKCNVRNIVGYNHRKKNAKPEAPPPEQQVLLDGVDPLDGIELPERLPYIVAIIDELADLMMVAPAEIETSIARLAQLARAAGIHLIIATQRPSVNVITGVIKANLPSRIAFQVASQVDSRTILDTKGAETLIGRGDMLFTPPGTSRVVRAQGAFTSDDEISELVEFLKQNGPPVYAQEVQAQIDRAARDDDEEGGEGDDGDLGDDEELYQQALEVLKSSRRASTSMLQRRLRIGYNRAARVMEIMEEKGIVGPENGSSPREILVDLDSL